jgi:hypothetical protein
MGFAQVPPAAITRVLATFERSQLEGFVAVAIDLMDLDDGNSDVEANGDELDGTNAEDEIGNNHFAHVDAGAGCPISDPDSAVDDSPCDEPFQDLEPEEGV